MGGPVPIGDADPVAARNATGGGYDAEATSAAEWNGNLATQGRRYMDAAIRDWWARWSRHRRNDPGIAGELEKAAQALGTTRVSPGLKQWLKTYDARQEHLSPDEARGWLATYRVEVQARRAAALPARIRGPGAHLPPKAIHYRMGKGMFKAATRAGTLKREDGQ